MDSVHHSPPNIKAHITRLRFHIFVWCLNRGFLKVKPWDDPRKPEEDRALWLKAQPKSLQKAG